jgi:hypothetical protein
VRCAVVAGIYWALVPPQPFAEQQVGTRQVGGRGGAAEKVDGLLIDLVGVIGRSHQRRGPGEQPKGPVGPAGGGAALEVGEGGGGFGGVPGAQARLDDGGQGLGADADGVIAAHRGGCLVGVGVFTPAEVEDSLGREHDPDHVAGAACGRDGPLIFGRAD